MSELTLLLLQLGFLLLLWFFVFVVVKQYGVVWIRFRHLVIE